VHCQVVRTAHRVQQGPVTDKIPAGFDPHHHIVRTVTIIVLSILEKKV